MKETPAPKPTFPAEHEWHTEECDVEYSYTGMDPTHGARAFWCQTHRQWFYEWPVKVTVTFKDDTELVVKDRTQRSGSS